MKGAIVKAVIMRGIPGAGKSSFVESLPGTKIICSADLAHVTGGVYRFDPAKKEKAHADCFDLWMRSLCNLRNGAVDRWEWLVCDNTNLTGWEVAPYFRTADWAGVPVEIVRIEVDPFVAARRNRHSVPTARVFEMWETLRRERLPSHFRERVILADSFDVPPGKIQSRRRRKSEVLAARNRFPTVGCCDRFADRKACDCLENADPD